MFPFWDPNAQGEVVQSVPAVGQVKAAKQTKKIWRQTARRDLVLSEQRELGDSSKLPPMVVDGGARSYDCTPASTPHWRGPRAQWLRTPRPALSVRQVWWKPAVV